MDPIVFSNNKAQIAADLLYPIRTIEQFATKPIPKPVQSLHTIEQLEKKLLIAIFHVPNIKEYIGKHYKKSLVDNDLYNQLLEYWYIGINLDGFDHLLPLLIEIEFSDDPATTMTLKQAIAILLSLLKHYIRKMIKSNIKLSQKELLADMMIELENGLNPIEILKQIKVLTIKFNKTGGD
jgi:hypothetical protein